MIHVDREREDADGQPIRPNDRWFRRAAGASDEVRRRAAALLTRGAGSEPSWEDFHFEAEAGIYAHDQVKIRLKQLFRDKCAYCESQLAAGATWDVEHYRPKGRVAQRIDHPGYYWLAYEWNNLYPSCQRCNRKLTDEPNQDQQTRGEAAGKLDQFPLEDESRRAMSHLDDVAEEEPLLLDPCHDEPSDYLSFALDGTPLSMGDGRKGEETIKILHLDRSDLCRARETRIREVLEIVETLIDTQPDPASALDRLAIILLKPSSLYLAACRAIWRYPHRFGLPEEPFRSSRQPTTPR